MPNLRLLFSDSSLTHALNNQVGQLCFFLAELKHLSEDSEFGITLDEMLRDRLVCGVRDIRIQRRLLAEPKLTLKRALK